MSWEPFAELGTLFLVTALAPTFNVFLPIRPTLLTIGLTTIIHWFPVGLVAALGGTVGALPLYGVALRLSETNKVRRWFSFPAVRWLLTKLQGKMFLLLVILILTPLPDQLIGLVGGTKRYPLNRFLLANLIGRLILYLGLAYISSKNSERLAVFGHWLLGLISL